MVPCPALPSRRSNLLLPLFARSLRLPLSPRSTPTPSASRPAPSSSASLSEARGGRPAARRRAAAAPVSSSDEAVDPASAGATVVVGPVLCVAFLNEVCVCVCVCVSESGRARGVGRRHGGRAGRAGACLNTWERGGACRAPPGQPRRREMLFLSRSLLCLQPPSQKTHPPLLPRHQTGRPRTAPCVWVG